MILPSTIMGLASALRMLQSTSFSVSIGSSVRALSSLSARVSSSLSILISILSDTSLTTLMSSLASSETMGLASASLRMLQSISFPAGSTSHLQFHIHHLPRLYPAWCQHQKTLNFKDATHFLDVFPCQVIEIQKADTKLTSHYLTIVSLLSCYILNILSSLVVDLLALLFAVWYPNCLYFDCDLFNYSPVGF